MLNFLDTMSVNTFKERMGQQNVELKKNSQTGKYFFSAGSITGAVSNKFIESNFQNPVISEVFSDENGETFYMMHTKGEGVTCIATF